jgi:geranylgeranyl reductase family protein
MTAYRLARAGVRVAILDAKRFPRDKACGGGVQEKAGLKIPFDWQPVVRRALCEVSFSFNLGERFTKGCPHPLVYSVLRTEFDDYLLQSAERAGARVWEGVRTTAVVTQGTGPVMVHTERGELNARMVVGADGANSVVSKALNARQDYFWQAGLYCEVPEECLNSAAVDWESMRIDWGTLPSGYAWIFPKKGSVNIGVGCPVSIGRALRPYLIEFLTAERALKPGALPRLRFSGHQLPTLTGRTRLAGATLLLVGDAAGLVEPFTGDGISYACHSAEIAADAILANLDKASPDLTSYDRRIKTEIGIDLYWARKLLSFSVTFPHLMYRIFKCNDEVWRAFCRVLRGQESFRVFKRKILGPLECVWMPIEFFAERCERRRLANFMCS